MILFEHLKNLSLRLSRCPGFRHEMAIGYEIVSSKPPSPLHIIWKEPGIASILATIHSEAYARQ